MIESKPRAAAEDRGPLFVDLDDALLKTDLLHESFVRAVRRLPLGALTALGLLARGRASLKARLAALANIDPATLPYNAEVLAHLREQKAAGRRLYLATGSDRSLAEAVAGHLRLFDGVIASDGVTNLKGRHKLQAIRAVIGSGPFDYVGNSRADIVIWQECDAMLVVGTRAFAERVGRAHGDVVRFDGRRAPWRAMIAALRPHQWVKNLLIFVPLMSAHRVFDGHSIGIDLLAFGAFCLCTSGVYLLNDLCDLDSDRIHPSKRHRPLAAGELSIAGAIGLALSLLTLAGILAVIVGWLFSAVLALYFVVTTAYSLHVKRVVILDVICLAALYALRVVAGFVTVAIPYSFWLLSFALFCFVSLAFLKRYAELAAAAGSGAAPAPGRGYVLADLATISTFGAASGTVSVLVIALYINSPEVIRLYHHPQLLWIVCPILLYWMARIWLVAQRGELDEDPIVFAIHDRVSLRTALLCLLVAAAASV